MAFVVPASEFVEHDEGLLEHLYSQGVGLPVPGHHL